MQLRGVCCTVEPDSYRKFEAKIDTISALKEKFDILRITVIRIPAESKKMDITYVSVYSKYVATVSSWLAQHKDWKQASLSLFKGNQLCIPAPLKPTN